MNVSDNVVQPINRYDLVINCQNFVVRLHEILFFLRIYLFFIGGIALNTIADFLSLWHNQYLNCAINVLNFKQAYRNCN